MLNRHIGFYGEAVDFGFNVRLGEFENSKPYGK
jgi:hypothetical protein